MFKEKMRKGAFKLDLEELENVTGGNAAADAPEKRRVQKSGDNSSMYAAISQKVKRKAMSTPGTDD